NPFLLRVLSTSLGLLFVGRVTAQTLTTLYSFTARNNSTNSDGAWPTCKLVLSSNILYGTTSAGGDSSYGTVFNLNTDGTSFKSLYSFIGPPNPQAGGSVQGLVLLVDRLYGTARGMDWVLFAVNSDGTGLSVLPTFTGGSDGGSPLGDMIVEGNTLYGTASSGGGASSEGTVFKLNIDGTGFTRLHTFAAASFPPFTNSDGAGPRAGVALLGNTLFGTTYYGGTSGHGTIFSVGIDGASFKTLYNFTGSIDGASPNGALLLASGTLHGTTFSGGGSGFGTVFAVNTNGTGLRTLHSFTPSDGTNPNGGLILSGNKLYGTAAEGGPSGSGTIFAVNTDGTGFTNLYSFTGSDGARPKGGLILSGNILYGTTSFGGNFGNGTVFSLSFPPHLNIISSGPNFILSWPTNYAGFDYTEYTLQSTTNLGSSAVWTTNAP